MHRIVHFYQHVSFQQWSFVPANHLAKMPDRSVFSTYKDPLKAYILQFTGDRSYYETKLKEGSLWRVHDASEHVIMGIDDRMNIIRFGTHCLSLAAMDGKYPRAALQQAFLRSDAPA